MCVNIFNHDYVLIKNYLINIFFFIVYIRFIKNLKKMGHYYRRRCHGYPYPYPYPYPYWGGCWGGGWCDPYYSYGFPFDGFP